MNSKARLVYQFGPYQLEPAEYRLLREGRPVALTPKAFETLRVLTENAGRVVEKTDLMTLVWPDTAVEESTLAQNIFTLRKVLGPSASGQPYIETVPKRGYRLAVPVREGRGEPIEESAETGDALPGRPQAPSRLRRAHLIGVAGVAATIVAVSIGVGFGVSPFSRWRPKAPMTIARLTNMGNSRGAAVSPDGKFVAYTLSNGGRESLWIRLVSAGRDVEIVPPAAERFQGITVSRDGNWVYYTRGTNLYEISVMGGQPRKMLDAVDSAISMSPGGDRFAFIRDSLHEGESAVIVGRIDGGATTKLATRKLPAYFRSAAWAPRGDVIVASAGTRAGERYMALTEIDVKTGTERALSARKWYETRELAWFSDETGLVLSASASTSEPFQLWRVSYPDGAVTKLTNDLDDYVSPNLTADSAGLVSSKRSDVSNIWVAPGPVNQTLRITAEGGRAERPSWTSDGRIVYEARTSGNRDVWIMDADGSNKKQLTFDPAADHTPTAARQGDHVYFVSDRTGVPHIWKMGTDGSNPKQLTQGGGELTPDCSPDDAWLVYEAVGSGRPLLWRVPTSGGTPVQLTTTLSRSPTISPDGRLIALYYWDERPGSPIRLAVIPSAGGPLKTFDFPDTIPSRILRWSEDGQSVTYIVTENGISNIWSQPLDGGPARPVTQFGVDTITFFDWSHSGGRLAFSRLVRSEDIVVISAFR